MILQRAALAIGQQNWSTVFIELFLVVIGILVALQVDNWSQARIDQDDLTQALIRLQGEVELNLEIIDNYIERIEGGREGRERTRVAIEECDSGAESIAIIEETLGNLTADFSPTYIDVTIKELNRQDRFLDILTVKFRNALNRYQWRLSEDQQQTETNFILLWDQHIIKHPAVDADFSLPIIEASLKLAKPLEQICKDSVFRRQLFITVSFVEGLNFRAIRLKEHVMGFQQVLHKELET